MFAVILTAVLINSASAGVLWCELCKCLTSGVADCKDSGLADVPNANASDPTNFKAVYLDGNEISRVTTFPSGKLNVTVLSFRNNLINEVDKAAFRFVGGLKEIDFSDNHLASDTLKGDAFQGLYSTQGFEPLEVEVLKLSRNGFHTLDPDLFEHLPYLKELTLDGNPLVQIDHPTLIALANIPRLQYLDLSRTKLRAIPDSMLHTSKNLRILNISYNEFDLIPTAIQSSHELQCLILSGNPIEEIYSSPYIPSLIRLELSSMPKLRKIGSRSLGNFTHLKELVIVNNTHLFEIAHDALVYEDKTSMKTWPQITKLNISYNKLAFLESEFIANWEKIQEFGMAANPWVCDCTNQWFLVELIPAIHKVQPEEAKQLTCQDPIEMRGMSMWELSQQGTKMRCLDKYGHQPENDATILIFLFIGMLFCLPVLIGGLFYYKRNYWNVPSAIYSYQRTGSLETIYHH